jgi:glycerol-3-phosphate dehydrogenase
VFKGDPRPLWQVRLGVTTYDLLALFNSYRQHRFISRKKLATYLPSMRSDDLRGGILYYDYHTNDARLVLENILAASAAGALCASYVQAKKFTIIDGKLSAVDVVDTVTGSCFPIRTTLALCAAGPWTDEVMNMAARDGAVHTIDRWLRPTKGVHIVVPRSALAIDLALVMRHPIDGRVLFVLPFHERTVIGTTDTDVDEHPDSIVTSAADVSYLITAARHYFPTAKIDDSDILSNWAGIRPLLMAKKDESPSAVSRRHRVEVLPEGIVTIAGGKLTTYRHMAEDCVKRIASELLRRGGRKHEKVSTARMPLPGAVGLGSDEALTQLSDDLTAAFKDREIGDHLAHTYGVRAHGMVEGVRKDPTERERIVAELPYVWAEIPFITREEMPLRLTDLMMRRTQIFFRDREQGLMVAKPIAQKMALHLGWDDNAVADQIASYRRAVEQNRQWRTSAL